MAHKPAIFHNSSTRFFTSGDISITPGQGRVKPSVGHLRVASIPIFEPKFGRRLEWSSESTGPSANSMSRSGRLMTRHGAQATVLPRLRFCLVGASPAVFADFLHVHVFGHDDDALRK